MLNACPSPFFQFKSRAATGRFIYLYIDIRLLLANGVWMPKRTIQAEIMLPLSLFYVAACSPYALAFISRIN